MKVHDYTGEVSCPRGMSEEQHRTHLMYDVYIPGRGISCCAPEFLLHYGLEPVKGDPA